MGCLCVNDGVSWDWDGENKWLAIHKEVHWPSGGFIQAPEMKVGIKRYKCFLCGKLSRCCLSASFSFHVLSSHTVAQK